jgi:hypothetical protein
MEVLASSVRNFGLHVPAASGILVGRELQRHDLGYRLVQRQSFDWQVGAASGILVRRLQQRPSIDVQRQEFGLPGWRSVKVFGVQHQERSVSRSCEVSILGRPSLPTSEEWFSIRNFAPPIGL